MAGLKGKTIIITGASRGIGKAMAVRFARDGANIVAAAKTVDPHPKLAGTLAETALAVEAAGGRALAIQVDVRFGDQVQAMVEKTVATFGGIDALVNNAGAISLTPVEKTPVKRYDLMQAVNARAVFVCSRSALPGLKQADSAHILNLSPPLNLDPKWLKGHGPYTLSKYGMTLLTMAMAAEFRPLGISVTSLWPRTAIATAAIEFEVGGADALKHCRKPEIMADAAYEILTTEDRSLSGRCLLDEEILAERGMSDFGRYAMDPAYTDQLLPDFFI